jgi:hypothetical protein
MSTVTPYPTPTHPHAGRGIFCVRCGSHFCPHVAGHLYVWPFTVRDERARATQRWNQWLAVGPSKRPAERRQRPVNETQGRLFGEER